MCEKLGFEGKMKKILSVSALICFLSCVYVGVVGVILHKGNVMWGAVVLLVGAVILAACASEANDPGIT
jgi:peptidoglycan/LPS O-acetylase OafA/YrhL